MTNVCSYWGASISTNRYKTQFQEVRISSQHLTLEVEVPWDFVNALVTLKLFSLMRTDKYLVLIVY